MKVILFGATGMVGQGVLRECLVDPDVDEVLSIGRSATGQAHPKLREVVHPDLLNLSAVESELAGFDACFFCLGVSSAGMNEKDYRRVTFDITLAAAQALARLPFKAAVMFRPAGIVPLHGVTSKTRLYRIAYGLTRPLWSVLLRSFPQYVTTTEQVGRAMLRVAKQGVPKPILETRDINALQRSS